MINNFKKILLFTLCLFCSKIDTSDEDRDKIVTSLENRVKDLEEKLREQNHINTLMINIIKCQQDDIKGLAATSIKFYEQIESLSSNKHSISPNNTNH